MKVLIYDATDDSPVGMSWRAGAVLYRPSFKHVIPARSWAQAAHWLGERVGIGEAHEIHFWGHGAPGAALIGKGNLTQTAAVSIGLRIAEGGLFWLRTCATFAGAPGRRAAYALSTEWMNCRVAAHTRNIGLLHSGTYSIRPGQMPYWPKSEDFERGRQNSGAGVPRTLPFFVQNLPKGW